MTASYDGKPLRRPSPGISAALYPRIHVDEQSPAPIALPSVQDEAISTLSVDDDTSDEVDDNVFELPPIHEENVLRNSNTTRSWNTNSERSLSSRWISSLTSRKRLVRGSPNDSIAIQTKGVGHECFVEEVTRNKDAGSKHQDSSSNKKRQNRSWMLRHQQSVRNLEYKPSFNHEEAKEIRQYRLTDEKKYINVASWVHGKLVVSNEEIEDSISKSQWSLSRSLLRWSYKTPFIYVFISAALFFFFITIAFALVYLVYGLSQNHCIYIGSGVEFGKNGTAMEAFADAYQLSWTTFSTVGYGLVHPSVQTRDPNCVLMNMFASFEAYVGVIFTSFVGAVFFGKVVRAISHAEITFSDLFIVKYGEGLCTPECECCEQINDESIPFSNGTYPCPILEFRLLNKLHASCNNEVMDCHIKCSIGILTSNCPQSVLDSAHRARRRRKSLSLVPPDKNLIYRRPSIRKSFILPSPHASSTSINFNSRPQQIYSSLFFEGEIKHTLYDEDESSPESKKIVQPLIFSTVALETETHPILERSWTVKHVLDVNSPLLKESTKELIRENDGSWPSILNSHKAIRESIASFEYFIVSLSGRSKATGQNVYATKIYEYADMAIGYKFVGILGMKDGKVVNFDPEMINVITEQNGGGGEPLRFAMDDDDNDRLTQRFVKIVKNTKDATIEKATMIATAAHDTATTTALQPKDRINEVI